MVFSSIIFVFTFLPAVIAVYYLTPARLRNFILLLASLFFYAWGEPVYLFLMIYSILFNYITGIEISRRKDRGRSARGSLLWGIVINFLILGFFKYYGFLAENLRLLFSLRLPGLDLPLPIGLSFYTFQSVSYLADVYRGNVKCQKNVIHFGLYIAMFPQLVAGPIVRYCDIEFQLKNREHNPDRFGKGALYFIQGLSKKVLLANNLGMIYTAVSALPSLSVLSAWTGALAYAFQIYFDFGGYSDMALGLAGMFGFELKPNFDYPYCARSVTQFWRRWHISLGTWFREYVYIPLGGNRKGIPAHIRNLLIVWTLTGLWHGASWNFVVWGLYYGVLLIGEKYIFQRITERIPVLGNVYAMAAVLVGWVIFFSGSLGEAWGYLGIMFGTELAALTDRAGFYYLLTGLVLFLLSAICSTPLPSRIFRRWFTGKGPKAVLAAAGCLALFLLCTAYLIHDTYNPFLYFRF